jgi:DNA-binding beta-propeller fold protein YncE
MTDLDDFIRSGLHVAMENLVAETGTNLSDVRRKSRRRSRRNRLVAAVAAVAVVAGVLAFGAHNPQLFGNSDEPAGRGHRPGFSPKPPQPFTVERTLYAQRLGLRQPRAIAVAPNGHYYVTDQKSQTVTEATPAGRVVRRWGRPGTGPGEFRLSNGGIAVGQDGKVYVADSGNARIQVFTANGTFLRQLGRFGNGPGQFSWPWAIAVDQAGAVYVSDDRAATLTKLSPTGRQLWRIGESDTNPDLAGHEHFGAVDSHGRLVTANDDAGKVLYLSPQGTEVDSFGTGASGDHENTLGHPPAVDFPGGACDTTVDDAGNVYVNSCAESTNHSHLIQVYNPSHHLVGQWVHSPLSTAPRFGGHGEAVALAPNGSILELSIAIH